MWRTARRALGSAGFTIVELVVVVLIVGVMTTIIAPTFRLSPTRRVESMAHLLVAHLEMARTQALGERQMVRIDFDTSAGTYVAYVDHDDDDAIAGTSAEISAFPEFGTRQLDERLAFGRGSASALPGDAGTDEITLTGDGFTLDRQAIPTPWGTMGTIYITHQDDSEAVAAVSVASSGAFEAWLWWPDPGAWR